MCGSPQNSRPNFPVCFSSFWNLPSLFYHIFPPSSSLFFVEISPFDCHVPPKHRNLCLFVMFTLLSALWFSSTVLTLFPTADGQFPFSPPPDPFVYNLSSVIPCFFPLPVPGTGFRFFRVLFWGFFKCASTPFGALFFFSPLFYLS